MSWNEIYRNMAYHPLKRDFAAARELQDSVKTLCLYLEGQARDYEVTDALRHIEYVCCANIVRRAVADFRLCLYWEDESARLEVAQQSAKTIAGWLEKNRSVNPE